MGDVGVVGGGLRCHGLFVGGDGMVWLVGFAGIKKTALSDDEQLFVGGVVLFRGRSDVESVSGLVDRW